jgi:hypothetical protein
MVVEMIERKGLLRFQDDEHIHHVFTFLRLRFLLFEVLTSIQLHLY